MSIFEFDDYKEFVQKAFAALPRRGHGQYRKLAQALRLSSVAVSQIFRGSRDLSPEQALETAQFLHLDPEESDFFLLLVHLARAGSAKLRAHHQGKIRAARERRAVLGQRVPERAELDDAARAIFYSNWHYSAVRIASSIPGLHSVDALSRHLRLSPEAVQQAAEFLLKHGLCVRDEATGGFRMGPVSTMLPNDSPYINVHRRNWRLKALESLRVPEEPGNLHYSGVVSLSEADARRLRQEMVDFVDAFIAKVKVSPSESLRCLNIDWFGV